MKPASFLTSLVLVATAYAAAGSETAVGDRAVRENVEPVDVHAVLEAVAALPIATWNDASESDEIRHMGPTARDFQDAFGLGLDEPTIDSVDADGVALAAIQGLRAELEELRVENRSLRRRLERLEQGPESQGRTRRPPAGRR